MNLPSRFLTLPWILLASLIARGLFAVRKGLVLDEFHTRFHATQESFGAFFEQLLQDNHPPLAFLLIAGSSSVFGDGELALRLPAILCGLLEIALVARLAGPKVAVLASSMVALSTLHFDWGTQVRMYAYLAVAVTGLTVALVEHLEGAPKRRRWMVLAVVLGFHCHYYTVHYCLGLALAVGLLALRNPEHRSRVKSLVPAGAIAVLLCLPWAWFGLREQLSHALPPGGDEIGIAMLAEALGHLFYINVQFVGEARPLMIAGAACMILLAAWAVMFEPSDPTPRGTLLVATAFGVPVLATGMAMLWSRSGFTWNYVLPSVAPMAILAARGTLAEGSLHRLRHGLAGYALVTMAVLVGLHLTSRGSEDFPGAVEYMLELHEEGDAIVSVEYQPAFFPLGMPWDYYAPRATEDPPARMEMQSIFVTDRKALDAAPRVLVLASKLNPGVGVRKWLEENRTLVSQERFGYGRLVLVYE